MSKRKYDFGTLMNEFIKDPYLTSAFRTIVKSIPCSDIWLNYKKDQILHIDFRKNIDDFSEEDYKLSQELLNELIKVYEKYLFKKYNKNEKGEWNYNEGNQI